MRSTPLAPTLAALAGAVVLLTSGHPPVVDEEVYLDLGRQVLAHPALPYAWSRAMQPWSGDSFLFAHPPLHWLWVALWTTVVGDGRIAALRIAVGLPPALLFGWAAARLARRTTADPTFAVAAWLLSPAALMALSAGLMVDLSAVALASAGVAAWREAQEAGAHRGWLVVAGVLLGLAVATKYPMAVAALAVAVHAWRLGRARSGWPAWAALFGVWGAVELWTGLAHGAFHPWAVLAHAGEIARGPLLGRLLGTLARLGLVLAPFAWGGRWRVLVAAALAMGLLAVAWPGELTAGGAVFLGLCAFLGALLAVRSWAAIAHGGDDLLLGTWALGTVFAVGLGHNFASGRYLLPAVLPLACLAARQEGVRRLTAVRLGLWGGLAVAMVVAEARYAWALQALAERAARLGTGFYTGEWAFRHTLDRAGWRPVGPGTAIPEGSLVVSPVSAGVGPLPWDRLALEAHLESPDRFPLRLTDQPAGAGWHAETLGPLPLAWRVGPLEEVDVYRAR